MKELAELIKEGNNDRLKKILESNPSAATARTEEGISLLQVAAYCRNREAVEILRSYKVIPDVFEAAAIGDMETMFRIIEEEPQWLNGFSADGFTILGLASFFGHLKMAEALLEKGADPNLSSGNAFKVTPLHSACAASNYDVAELLIRNGADVNARQIKRVTSLHSAAHNGRIDLVHLLVNNGADLNAKTDDGQTPLQMAEEKGFREIIEFLKVNGAL